MNHTPSNDNLQPQTLNALLAEDAVWFQNNRHLPFRYRTFDRKEFTKLMAVSSAEQGLPEQSTPDGERFLVLTLLVEMPTHPRKVTVSCVVLQDLPQEILDRAEQADFSLGFELIFGGVRQRDRRMIDLARLMVIRAEVDVPPEWDIWSNPLALAAM